MPGFFFPKKPYPEDSDFVMAWSAKALFFTGLLMLVWSGYHLAQWSGSSGYIETEGVMRYGSWQFIRSGLRQAAFDYDVGGKPYSSDSIAFGGRPLGALPEEGKVKVYYDPGHPERAVLMRWPSGVVVLGFLFGLGALFLARFIWVAYV